MFLIPSKTDGKVPSQQGVPTTCNLTYWEVSQQTYLQAPLTGLGEAQGHRTKFRPSVGGRGGHRNMGVAKRRIYSFWGWGSFWQKTHARYSTHQIPTDTHSYIFPSNTFHLWTYHFFQTPIQRKTGRRTYIFLETDLLGAPDACYGCKKFWSTCWFSYLFIF